MNDSLRLTDPAADLRSSLLRLIEKEMGAGLARRAIDLQMAAANAPLNPLGAAGDAGHESTFATGYDGTNTVVPFIWGVTNWNNGDTWTGS